MHIVKRWIGGIIIGIVCAIASTGTVAAQGPADCRIDAVLLFDRAGSAAPDDFARMKTFATNLVGALPIGGVRIGVIAFDAGQEVRLGLSGDANAVSGAIAGITSSDGAADLFGALEAGAVLLADARPYTTRAVVLITDGFSTRDARQRARELNAEGLSILAFGVGSGVNRYELGNIGLSYMDSSSTFERAPDYAGAVAQSLCRASAVVGGRVAGRTLLEGQRYTTVLPVQGATVTLLTLDETPIASTRTDANGAYRFYVDDGQFAMRIEAAEGLAFAPGNDGFIPQVFARRGSSSTRAYTLMDVITP